MILRDYQQKIIGALRSSILAKNKRIVMCAPTGSGKTVMFSFMVTEHLKKGGRVLIFTHRKELLKQAGRGLENAEYIKAGSYPSLDGCLHISMIETFARRIEKYDYFLQTRTMIIFDEAHLENFTKIFKHISPETIVIGATATPERKGKQNSLSDFYTDLVQDVDTIDLIEMGFLSRAKSYGVEIDLSGCKKSGDDYDTSKYYEENKLYLGVVENYERLAKHKKTIVFSSNVKNSIDLCAEFNEHGYNARHIDANSNNREDVFEWFDKSTDGILCNCGIATTGFDQPDVECVILYRATTSLTLFLQMVGRGSRITPTKKEFTILDFGNNIKRLGFWENPRIWSLQKKVKKEGVAPVKFCPGCGAIVGAKVKECEYCGYKWKETEKEIKEREFAELKLLTQKEAYNRLKTGSIYQAVDLVRAKKISAFYVLHQMTDIDDARLFINLMGYKKGFEYANKDRFKVFRGQSTSTNSKVF